jgi:hypothetical protein
VLAESAMKQFIEDEGRPQSTLFSEHVDDMAEDGRTDEANLRAKHLATT